MSIRRAGGVLVLALVLTASLLPVGSARAAGPGKWAKLATANDASDTVGMLRTPDGDLHLVWENKAASPTSHQYGTAKLSLSGGILGTAPAFPTPWDALEGDPQLVSAGTTNVRLVFEGSVSGGEACFANSLVFTATSGDGLGFILQDNTSLSNASANIGNLAATVESNGTTPVATFANGHLFHAGTDTCPAPPGSDGTINNESGSANPSNPAIVTDRKDGSVWVAWFQTTDDTTSYRVAQILPTKATPLTAPGSGSTLGENNQPHQSVALAARGATGGVDMAYCVASSTKQCAHIALWRVGSASAVTVPDSSTGTAEHVALAAGKAGRISVMWYDSGQNLIHAVRTNTTATAFGIDRTIKPPPNTSEITDLQGEGTFGRLDVVVNATLNVSGFPSTIWQTQILAGLSLAANPAKFSHTAATTVTFTVKDAEQAQGGVKVACIGRTGITGPNGQVKITFPKGTATGKHVCTASKPDYNPGKATITVT